MAVLEVGIALVVEIVQQAGQAPQLDVAVEPRRVGPHRGLDGQHVPRKESDSVHSQRRVQASVARNLAAWPLP